MALERAISRHHRRRPDPNQWPYSHMPAKAKAILSRISRITSATIMKIGNGKALGVTCGVALRFAGHRLSVEQMQIKVWQMPMARRWKHLLENHSSGELRGTSPHFFLSRNFL